MKKSLGLALAGFLAITPALLFAQVVGGKATFGALARPTTLPMTAYGTAPQLLLPVVGLTAPQLLLPVVGLTVPQINPAAASAPPAKILPAVAAMHRGGTPAQTLTALQDAGETPGGQASGETLAHEGRTTFDSSASGGSVGDFHAPVSARIPPTVGAPWAEFGRGFLELGKYPPNTAKGDERIDQHDIRLWEKTRSSNSEHAVWEAFGEAGKRVAIGRYFSGAQDHLGGELLKRELEWLLGKIRENGIPLSSITKIRGRHTHPSGASDRFSNGDVTTAFDFRSYLAWRGLSQSAFEQTIIYVQSTFFGGRWRLFKRSFILPPLS
ncbi:MAG: hypothetical protein HYV14_10740 [Elusimicrobia bacterium]|nr:hypothetical protein [Elusimicrobiota bacterium]